MNDAIYEAFADELEKVGFLKGLFRRAAPKKSPYPVEVIKGTSTTVSPRTERKINTAHTKAKKEYEGYHDRMSNRLAKMDELLARARSHRT